MRPIAAKAARIAWVRNLWRAGLLVALLVVITACVNGGSFAGSPAVPAPRQPGDVVGLRLENIGQRPEPGRIVTFGQAFAKGDVPRGTSLVARIGDRMAPLQVDAKATHADGSLRHAVLSLEAPPLAPGAGVDMILAKGAATSQPAIDVARIRDAGYDVALEVSVGGTTRRIAVADLLVQAVGAGSLDRWLHGPLATEIRLRAPITPDNLLHALFDVRAYADGSVRTDVILAYDWAYTVPMENITYDATIRSNGEVVAQYDDLEHYHHSRWHKVVWSTGEPDIHVSWDPAYLVQSAAVPRIDTSIEIDGSVIAKDYDALRSADTGPMGLALNHHRMPDAGQTDKQNIGLISNWQAKWLLSQDPREMAIVLANADSAAGIPWHFRDEDTGRPVTIEDHPGLRIQHGKDGRGDDALPRSYTAENTKWTPDSAHEPPLNYLPYLITGDRNYLDQLQYQAAFQLAHRNPQYRSWAKGLFTMNGAEEARGIAWTLRTLTDAAWITPDDDPLKGYFERILDNNLSALIQRYVVEGRMSPRNQWDGNLRAAGEVEGYLRLGRSGRGSPFEQDLVTLVLGWAVDRGYAKAAEFLTYQIPYTTGRFISGDKGFDPTAGAAYKFQLWNKKTQVPYATWAEVYKASFKNRKFKRRMGGNIDSPGTYAAIARAALATLVRHTGHPNAVKAYEYVLAETKRGKMERRYSRMPKWAIVP